MKLKYTMCALLASCLLLSTGCTSSSEKDVQTAEAETVLTSESKERSPESADAAQAAPETVESSSPATTENVSTNSDNIQTSEVSDTAETTETPETDVQLSAEDGNIGDIVLQSGDIIAEFEIEGYGTIKAKLFPEIAPVGVDNFVKLANNGYYDGLNIHRVIADFMLQGGSLNGDGTGGEAADGGEFGTEISEYARHFYGALCYANAGGRNTTQFYIVNNKQSQDIKATLSPDDLRETAEICRLYRDMYADDPAYYNYYDAMAVYYANLADLTENASDEVIAKYKETGGTPSLDGGYTVFGQVYEGLDVIDSISACEVRMSPHDELSEPVETITITSVKISEYAG